MTLYREKSKPGFSSLHTAFPALSRVVSMRLLDTLGTVTLCAMIGWALAPLSLAALSYIAR